MIVGSGAYPSLEDQPVQFPRLDRPVSDLFWTGTVPCATFFTVSCHYFTLDPCSYLTSCTASSAELYCLETEAHVCEQFARAQGHYMKVEQTGVEAATS